MGSGYSRPLVGWSAAQAHDFVWPEEQTEAGRYLFCVVIRFPDGNGYPISARDMTANEKNRFRKWRDR